MVTGAEAVRTSHVLVADSESNAFVCCYCRYLDSVVFLHLDSGGLTADNSRNVV